MKFTFKVLIIFLPYQLIAARPISITFNQQFFKAKQVRSILERKFHIPSELIFIKQQRDACSPVEDVVIQVCISNNEDVTFPIQKKNILRNSFAIFFEDIPEKMVKL
jgi:hypothetical protein